MSARPGRVRTEVEVEFTRPRELALKRTLEFQQYVELIASLLEDETENEAA
jgi:hypothetical protein